MSLKEAINTQPGAYINGTITAKVKFAKSRGGKFGTYETGVLQYDGVEASVMCDGPLLVANNEKVVTFSGKGMRRKEDYNGKAQLSFGKQVQVSEAGEPTPTEQHSAETQAFPTKPATKQAHTATETALNGAELAKAWADLAVATREAFNAAGLPEIADNAALRAPEWGALWWFGQRTVETPAVEQQQESPF